MYIECKCAANSMLCCLLVGLLLIVSSVAQACSTLGTPPTDQELFDRAKQVFVAQIVATKLADLDRTLCGPDKADLDECVYIEGHYKLVETIKGKPKAKGKVSDVLLMIGNCGLGIFAGWYYVFYVGPKDNYVLWPNGSIALGPFLEEDGLKIIENIKIPPHLRPQGQNK